MATKPNRVRQLAILGVGLVLLGLFTGFASGQLANPRMGLSSHLEALMNGTLMLALAGVWGHIRLSARAEGWAVWLLGYGSLANWLATLLAAIWGAGRETMPIAAQGHSALPWQETVVMALLGSLSVAMVAGFALVLYGLVRARTD